MLEQSRSKRKISGGRYRDWRKKKARDLSGSPRFPKIAKRGLKTLRLIGGSCKVVLLNADEANVYDSKTKKYVKAKIETVVNNPANRNFVRRNILTKGTVVKTDKGNAKITNRPGQEGTVNAILIEK